MSASQAEVAARYGVVLVPEAERLPPPELFPRKSAYVVRHRDGERIFEVMSWGFPLATKTKSGKPSTKAVTNVRNYTSPFWRSALANPERRCLVPFTSFSEYGQVRDQAGKLPLHWFDVPSQPITSFAGVWRPAEGGAVFAFLTCEPNPLVATIHPKAMPVLLQPKDEDHWLSFPFEDAVDLAKPFPSQLMRVDG